MKQGDTVVPRPSQCQLLSGVLEQGWTVELENVNGENVCRLACVENAAGRFDRNNVKTHNREDCRALEDGLYHHIRSETICEKMTETASACLRHCGMQKFVPFLMPVGQRVTPCHNHQFPLVACYQ